MEEILKISQIAKILNVSTTTVNMYLSRPEFNKYRIDIPNNCRAHFLFSKEMAYKLINLTTRRKRAK